MINVTMRWNHGNRGPVSWNKRRCIWFSLCPPPQLELYFVSFKLNQRGRPPAPSFFLFFQIDSAAVAVEVTVASRRICLMNSEVRVHLFPCLLTFWKGRCQNYVLPAISFLSRAPGAFPAAQVPVVPSWAGSEGWNETRNLCAVMTHHGTLQTWRFHISCIVFVCFVFLPLCHENGSLPSVTGMENVF